MEKYCDESKAFDCGVKWAVIYLNQCHDLGLHRDSFHAPSFQRAAQSFLSQNKSLEEAMGTDHFLWVLKPKLERQEGHLPEWQGLVVGCRILGVLAVDVCKGFVVTTMCLSCEKLQSSHSAAAEQWSNMWLAKQGVPKNTINKTYINKNCLKKGSGWKGGKTNKNKEEKHVRKRNL